jgi:hypothetical protein
MVLLKVAARLPGAIERYMIPPTAWAARRSVRSLLPILGMLKRKSTPVRVLIGGFVSLEVLPRSNALIRIVVPELAGLP